MKPWLTSRIVLIFVLFVALMLATVGVLSYRSGSESLKAAAVSELLAVAIEEEAALDHWIEDRLVDLEQLAAENDLVEKAGMLIAAAPDSEEARAAHALLIQEIRPHMSGANTNFIEVFAVEQASGRVVASTSRAEEGKLKIGRPYFENGKTGPYVQAPYLSPSLAEELTMTAAVPLRSVDGRVIGVLAARLNLATLGTIAQHRRGLRQTDDSFLVNADRLLISRPRFVQGAGVPRQQIDSEAAHRCADGNSGVVLGPDYRGVAVITVYRWDAKWRLGLIVEIDQAEALAPARAFGRSVLLISGLSLLGTAALALLLSRTVRQGTTKLAETNLALHAENIERKRAELEVFHANRSLQQQQSELRVLFDLMPAMIWFKDTENRILRVNKRVAEAAGKSLEAIEGKPSVEIYPQEAAKFFVDDLQVIQSGAPKLGIIEILRTPDGLERWVQTDKVPVRDKDGKVIGIVVMAQDITELKHAAELLEKSEAHQSAIVESALDCIITMNAKGAITEFNPSAEETFGYARSAVLGKKFVDVIVPPERRADHLDRMAVYLAAGESDARALERRLERSALRADGTEFPVEFAVTGATIQGERSITVFARDITERKHAEMRVEALHKELLDASRRAGMAEVATGVLHNVGNVLNSINVSTSIVVERLQKSRVSRLSEVAKLLTEHTADLPDFLIRDERGRNLPEFLAQLAAHLDRETREIAQEMRTVSENVEHIKGIVHTQQSYAGSFGVLEPIDLRDSVEDALRIQNAALNRHEVNIVRELKAIPTVVVDKHKVLQILVNLISNAKYAMTDSPVKTLTIKTYPSADGGIQLSIHDTGCGIIAENITRIFAHGFTTKRDGHGFGLHSSALAAKEMNAMLIASSEGAGQGAVFTLVFPPAVPGQIAA
jgi:PAS domain S-box-containing protein